MVISKQCISQQMNRPSSVGNFNLVYRALSLLLRSLTVEFFLLYILWLQLKVQTLQASSVHVSTQSAIIKTSYYSAVKKNKTAAHTVRLYRGHIVYCSKYREWWRSRLKKYHGDRDEKKVSVGVPLGGFLIKAARRDVDFGWRAALTTIIHRIEYARNAYNTAIGASFSQLQECGLWTDSVNYRQNNCRAGIFL